MRSVTWKFCLALAVVAGAALPSAASADTLNLTSSPCYAGTTCTGTDLGGGYWSFEGLIWSVTTTQPTGSGYIDSFVRIGSNQDVVDGMNTSGDLLNEEKPGPTFTHDVILGDVATFDLDFTNNTYDGEYYKFLLDINQEGGDPLLSLSGLQFCTSSNGSQTAVDSCAGGSQSDATLRYNLGDTSNTGSPDNNVLLDYNLNSGSGSGDLFVYVPTTLFAGLDPEETYLYLWSQFGRPKTVANNNDGYEEWAFENISGGDGGGQPLTGTPEPASLIMLGTGLIAGAAALRRRSKQQKATGTPVV